MTATANPPAKLFILWFRPGAGRWKRVGTFGTSAEAMNAIGAKGDWRVQELRADPSAQPSLFDADDVPTGRT